MKIVAFVLVVVGIVFAAACGDSGGTSSGGSTGEQTCKSSHFCINGSCHCGSDGKGQSCSDDSKCESQCEVCM